MRLYRRSQMFKRISPVVSALARKIDNKLYVGAFVAAIAAPVTMISLCEQNEKNVGVLATSPNALPMNFMFHSKDVPSDFNYGRFIKFMFRNEEQMRKFQIEGKIVVNSLLDHYDVCYSFWSEEFEGGSPSAKTADLFVKDSNSDADDDEADKIGVQLQVDFKSEVTWLDLKRCQDFESVALSFLNPSAPVPETPTQDHVRELVFDTFLEAVLNPNRGAMLILMTTDNCPVCSKAKMVFPASASLALAKGVEFATYSLSANALPPGVPETSIPGTPHYIYLPPATPGMIHAARSTLGPHYRNITRRDFGVSPTTGAVAAQQIMNERLSAAHEGDGVLSDVKIFALESCRSSDFLHALKGLEINPLEAIKNPDRLEAASVDDDALRGWVNLVSDTGAGVSPVSLVGALSAGLLMLQISQMKSNRDYLIESIVNTMDKFGFFTEPVAGTTKVEHDAAPKMLRGLVDLLDVSNEEAIRGAEKMLAEKPAETIRALQALRKLIARQTAIVDMFMEKQTSKVNPVAEHGAQ